MLHRVCSRAGSSADMEIINVEILLKLAKASYTGRAGRWARFKVKVADRLLDHLAWHAR